jgi:flagellin
MAAINTNTNALYAQDALKTNARAQATAMQQLSTGSRINSAKDDAAGLAIGMSMTSQIRGLNQGARNVNDAVNLLQTADGAMVETQNMIQRMRELAVQSANATYSGNQRGYLQNEFSSLALEVDRVAANSKWNDTSLLSSSVSYAFQAGNGANQTITVTIGAMAGSALGLGVGGSTMTISTAAGSQLAIGLLDIALESVNSQRATIGGTVNQLTYSADNMTNIASNLMASRSTIMDTDYATASSQLSRTQIIQQAATAMLAQANQQPQSVLTLLK